MHSEVWKTIETVARKHKIVILRAVPASFYSSPEWDILVKSGSAHRVAREVFALLPNSLSAIAVTYSPISCKLVVFDNSPDKFPNESLILDVRGPIIKNSSIFLALGHFESKDKLSTTQIPLFIDPVDEATLLTQRNLIDAREMSPKHLAIMNHTRDTFTWKSSLGKIVYLKRTKFKKVRMLWRRTAAQYWLTRSRCGVLASWRFPRNFSFHGPDGVGKTSLVNEISKILKLSSKASSHYFKSDLSYRERNLVNQLFPNLFLIRLIKYLLIRKFGLLSPSSGVRLFDRHIYDFIDKQAQHGRMAGKTTRFFMVWLQGTVVTPFLLVAPVRSILERSDELSGEQVAGCYERLGLIGSKSQIQANLLKRWIIVDASGGLLESQSFAISAIGRIQKDYVARKR